MKNLVLIKGLDYRGHSIFAEKGKIFSINDDKAKVLLKTGFFSEISNPNVDDPEVDDPEVDDSNVDDSNVDDPEYTTGNNDESIEKMKKYELIAYAKEKGIDISDCNNNDSRIAKIKAVEAEGNSNNDVVIPGFNE